VNGVLFDLSEGGCGVEIGMEMPAQTGDQVKVDLFVEGETLKRKGIIRHIRLIRDLDKETRVGIEFLDEGDQVAEHYRQLTKGLLTRVK
jgi:c-di-GMP-binding flagellar brake protein YcgR